MNIIKITPDKQITIEPYPVGSIVAQNEQLCRLIGAGCTRLESVEPWRL